MNQELIETMLNSIMQDVSQMKKDIEELKKARPQQRNKFSSINPNKPATQAQLDAVAIKGGKIWEGMTHQDITNQFIEINKRRNAPQELTPQQKKIESAIDNLPEVNEPESVDTNEAGLDDQGLM